MGRYGAMGRVGVAKASHPSASLPRGASVVSKAVSAKGGKVKGKGKAKAPVVEGRKAVDMGPQNGFQNGKS